MFNPFGICGQVVCQNCDEEVRCLKPAGLFGLTESWTEEPGLKPEKQVELSPFQSKRHHQLVLLSFSSPWTVKRLTTSWAASFHVLCDIVVGSEIQNAVRFLTWKACARKYHIISQFWYSC